ncbi:hypothetical protein HID58_075692 [Brassica napus]|uniref:Secreted protein n=2 Tax=Brassica TaxID=3705 RepID=A0ABQ7YKC5_BRANA|nr:hypothetical protein F2Q69_00054750 [Brassica cretica]KAH0868670.1 hypothetical protein HID58_075692 [Brassica napus]
MTSIVSLCRLVVWDGLVLSYCCTFFCYDLLHTKRRRRCRNRRCTEDDDDKDACSDDDDGSFRYHRPRLEMRKKEQSLHDRPRSHRVRVGLRKQHRFSGGVGPVHGIRLRRESKFARKGVERRTRAHHGLRRA